MFGRATITLGIGPHSSFFTFTGHTVSDVDQSTFSKFSQVMWDVALILIEALPYYFPKVTPKINEGHKGYLNYYFVTVSVVALHQGLAPCTQHTTSRLLPPWGRGSWVPI